MDLYSIFDIYQPRKSVHFFDYPIWQFLGEKDSLPYLCLNEREEADTEKEREREREREKERE